ncbi:hypothetical protein B0H13DRAFT_2412796, partial [Mycena leptocephala]
HLLPRAFRPSGNSARLNVPKSWSSLSSSSPAALANCAQEIAMEMRDHVTTKDVECANQREAPPTLMDVKLAYVQWFDAVGDVATENVRLFGKEWETHRGKNSGTATSSETRRDSQGLSRRPADSRRPSNTQGFAVPLSTAYTCSLCSAQKIRIAAPRKIVRINHNPKDRDQLGILAQTYVGAGIIDWFFRLQLACVVFSRPPFNQQPKRLCLFARAINLLARTDSDLSRVVQPRTSFNRTRSNIETVKTASSEANTILVATTRVPFRTPACRRTFEIWENYRPNSSHIPAPSITSPKGNAVLFYSESLAERKMHRITLHVPPSRPVAGVFPSPPRCYANCVILHCFRTCGSRFKSSDGVVDHRPECIHEYIPFGLNYQPSKSDLVVNGLDHFDCKPTRNITSISSPDVSAHSQSYLTANTTDIQKISMGSNKVTPLMLCFIGPWKHPLELAPLVTSNAVIGDDGKPQQKYEVVIPPHSSDAANDQVYWNTDLDFSLQRTPSDPATRITHHDSSSADVWVSAFIEQPSPLLFTVCAWHGGSFIRRGAKVRAPNAWGGWARVVGKIGASPCRKWILFELRMQATSKTIYLRAPAEYAKDDDTWSSWVKTTGRVLWQEFRTGVRDDMAGGRRKWRNNDFAIFIRC